MSNFIKIRQVVAGLFDEDRCTDERTDEEKNLSLSVTLQKRLKLSCHLFRLCLSHSFIYNYKYIEILEKQ
jgi:hypothetical protein